MARQRVVHTGITRWRIILIRPTVAGQVARRFVLRGFPNRTDFANRLSHIIHFAGGFGQQVHRRSQPFGQLRLPEPIQWGAICPVRRKRRDSEFCFDAVSGVEDLNS